MKGHLLLICLLATCTAVSLRAQSVLAPVKTKVGIVYNKETNFNLRISTNRGIIPGIEFGRLKTYYKTTYNSISIGELKHPKEVKQSAPPQTRAFRPFIYGKTNTMLVVRGSRGVKRYYSEKARQKGVAVGISYSFGPSLGLLKPYYLALARTNPDRPGVERISYERYSEENKNLFLDNLNIRGAAQFRRGLNEISLLPGANAAIAYHMDWGAFDEFVKALEIGIMADFFFKPAPLLATEQNNRLFFNFFVNLQLGKRK